MSIHPSLSKLNYLEKIEVLHTNQFGSRMKNTSHSQVNNVWNKEDSVILNAGKLNLSNSSLTTDSIIALEDLGSVLISIHKRMKSEGYEIKEGCIQKILM